MKIVKKRIFKATVKVDFPSAEGEEVIAQSFIGHFEAKPYGDLEQYTLDTFENQQAYLRAIFVGWEGLTDDTGPTEVPFAVTPENHEFLINDVFIRPALMKTYIQALAGAKRGN